MWVMIIRELPPLGVEESGGTRVLDMPPVLSIHWAVAWPNAHYVELQKQAAIALNGGVKHGRGKYTYWSLDEGDIDPDELVSEDDPYAYSFASEVFGGNEANWKGALKIHWQDADLRIFPHEYSKLKTENMHLYVFGDEQSAPSHELVAATVAEQQLIAGQIDNDMRPAWEAALLDGCTPDQATAVMLGQDIFDDTLEFSPIGWYRPKQEIAEYFGFAA
jgi:hypothetical protein